jgi:hypothetical protein
MNGLKPQSKCKMTCEELEEQFCKELQKVKPKWKITPEILKEL